MDNIKKLSDLSPGEKGRVLTLNSGEGIRRRLLDIGLIPGTLVTCVFKSPWGDPSAYLIRGALIALRNEDADKITVSPDFGGV